ncbi:MAG: phosphohistidine phosphatase SixA [Gammaproteobacteria bacterium]|nr:phosphohistidine phosphatase SixA [Gammaproteobacteria bacterium]
MRLYILRHGEAATPANGGASALTALGRSQASKVASLLAEDQSPQLILHSPKLRAVQTMEEVRSAVPGASCEVAPALAPESSPTAVEELLAAHDQGSILLISHLPLVAGLVAWFCSGDSRDFPLPGYSPAGLVALDMEPAARGCGIIAYTAFGPDYVCQEFAKGRLS